jgi:hypothetical protein
MPMKDRFRSGDERRPSFLPLLSFAVQAVQTYASCPRTLRFLPLILPINYHLVPSQAASIMAPPPFPSPLLPLVYGIPLPPSTAQPYDVLYPPRLPTRTYTSLSLSSTSIFLELDDVPSSPSSTASNSRSPWSASQTQQQEQQST